jgi:hypothetical protein
MLRLDGEIELYLPALNGPAIELGLLGRHVEQL